MQWRSFAFVAVVCWVLWPSVGTAQANPVDEPARFELFTDCAPLRIEVLISKSETAISLAMESVQAAVESRLRSARLYSAESPYLLGVNITVVGWAFGVQLGLYKWLLDPIAGGSGSAVTWQLTAIGTHADNPGYILSSVAEYMDQFLVEYLRVNEAACG